MSQTGRKRLSAGMGAKEPGMKRNTAIVALAAWLLASPAMGAGLCSSSQLAGAAEGVFRARCRLPCQQKCRSIQRDSQNAPEYLGQSGTLPPITACAGIHGGAPQQLSLPPITGSCQWQPVRSFVADRGAGTGAAPAKRRRSSKAAATGQALVAGRSTRRNLSICHR
jgi:hypothetical protein